MTLYCTNFLPQLTTSFSNSIIFPKELVVAPTPLLCPSRFSSGSTTYDLLLEILENKKPQHMTCGGVRDVSRETLGWEVFGHRKPVSELGGNLTMNYWGKRNPDHLVLNLCHFWGSWSASGYVLNLYFFLTFFLSYRKLFFYTNVRGSYWSSHT